MYIYIFSCPHSAQPYCPAMRCLTWLDHVGCPPLRQSKTGWIAPQTLRKVLHRVSKVSVDWRQSSEPSGFHDKTAESALPKDPAALALYEVWPNLSKYRSHWGAQRSTLAMTCQPSDLRPLSATIAYVFSAQQGTWNSASVLFSEILIFLLVDLPSLHQRQTTPCPPIVLRSISLERQRQAKVSLYADCTLCYLSLCTWSICLSQPTRTP